MSEMKDIKLTYFNIMGLGETLRFMLSYMGKEFEDFRIPTLTEWITKYKKIAGIGEGLGSQIMKDEKSEKDRSSQFHMSLLSGGQMLSSLGPLGLHGPLLRAAPFLQWSADQVSLMSRTTNNNNEQRAKSSEKESPSPPLSGGKNTTAPNNRERQFVCRICNHSFGYKHVLQNHERTHTGEAPFECPHCHKRFKRDHHLKTHIRLHTGEKPYHCPHCDRNFVQVANLRRHLRVHTGERPYACQMCSSKFSDSNQLKAHTLIHRGEKPFQCSCCQTRFRRRHHLVHHKCQQEEEQRKSSRKPKEVRRVVRDPSSTILSLPLIIPEQTEPEDLSMSTGIKNNNYKNNNNNSNSSEGEPDELSDSWEDMS